MPRYVFYTDSIAMDALYDRDRHSINTNAIHTWQEKNFDQCSYVMKNAQNISFATQQDYANFDMRIRISGELSEQDYIMYRLKY